MPSSVSIVKLPSSQVRLLTRTPHDKSLRSFPLLLILPAALAAEPMSKAERQRLVAHFEMTERWLGQELAGLSEAQLGFRASADNWPILDVLDHLATAEPQNWQWLQEGIQEEPTLTRSADPDENFVWYGIDRTNRHCTGEARQPPPQLETSGEGLAKIRALRARMLEYARTTNDDLRTRSVQKSKTDLSQWFLMISTHSMRHLLQIQEIKAEPNYARATAATPATAPRKAN
jgi:hypothetical protein